MSGDRQLTVHKPKQHDLGVRFCRLIANHLADRVALQRNLGAEAERVPNRAAGKHSRGLEPKQSHRPVETVLLCAHDHHLACWTLRNLELKTRSSNSPKLESKQNDTFLLLHPPGFHEVPRVKCLGWLRKWLVKLTNLKVPATSVLSSRRALASLGATGAPPD